MLGLAGSVDQGPWREGLLKLTATLERFLLCAHRALSQLFTLLGVTMLVIQGV